MPLSPLVFSRAHFLFFCFPFNVFTLSLHPEHMHIMFCWHLWQQKKIWGIKPHRIQSSPSESLFIQQDLNDPAGISTRSCGLLHIKISPCSTSWTQCSLFTAACVAHIMNTVYVNKSYTRKQLCAVDITCRQPNIQPRSPLMLKPCLKSQWTWKASTHNLHRVLYRLYTAPQSKAFPWVTHFQTAKVRLTRTDLNCWHQRVKRSTLHST